MAKSESSRVGKFYRFTPRSQWPRELQNSIPDDPKYMMHPVIFLSLTESGMAEVVTCTTHPHPEIFGRDAYVRVAQELTMTSNSPRPKATTWVGLNTRRVFPKDIFCRFRSEKLKNGKKKQFALKKIAARRLRELVKEYEENHDMLRSMSSATSKQVKSAPKKEKTACTSIASMRDGPVTRTQIQSDIQEIRASLSCIKQFVAALEELCERMETNSHASHNLAKTVSKKPEHLSTDSPNREMETSGNDEDGHLDEPPSSITEVTDGEQERDSGTTESTSSSKRWRISNWVRNVCRRRSSSGLASS